VIETNEEGSEAAAVTVVGVAMSAMPQFQTFTADRPFFFIIRDDRSGSILFMGTLVQPEKI
jgi:serpin B